MRSSIAVVVFSLLLAGCQAVGDFVAPSTPEAQIKAGADSITATTVLATTLLKNDKITVEQAKSFRAVLKTGAEALDDMGASLATCRKATASKPDTSPDPCRPKVVDVINVVLTSVASVKRALDAK